MAWWVKRPRWQKVTSLLHSRSPICRLLPPRLTKPVVVYSWELFSWQIAPSDMSRSPNICEPSVKLTTSWGERWTVCRLVWSMQSVKVVLVRAVLGGGGVPSHANTEHSWRGCLCLCIHESFNPGVYLQRTEVLQTAVTYSTLIRRLVKMWLIALSSCADIYLWFCLFILHLKEESTQKFKLSDTCDTLRQHNIQVLQVHKACPV